MLASYLHLLPTEHLKLKWLLRNQKKFFPYYLTASSSAKCNYFPLIKGLHPGSAGSWRSPALNWKLFISAQHSGTQSSRNPNWFPPWHCIPLTLSSLEAEAKPGLHQLRKLWWCHTQVSSRSQYAHGGLSSVSPPWDTSRCYPKVSSGPVLYLSLGQIKCKRGLDIISQHQMIALVCCDPSCLDLLCPIGVKFPLFAFLWNTYTVGKRWQDKNIPPEPPKQLHEAWM